MPTPALVCLYLAVTLGAMRLAGCKDNIFKALAHVYVGGVFGAYLAGHERIYLWIGVGLSVLEVIAFAASRFAKRSEQH